MSDTTSMECKCCGFDTDCIEGLCEPCNDFNHIFQKQIDEARRKLVAIKDQRDELLKACKAQHEAIDRLFALLISHDSGFFPSKSGQPWQAILQGNAAIAEAEKQA